MDKSNKKVGGKVAAFCDKSQGSVQKQEENMIDTPVSVPNIILQLYFEYYKVS